MVRAPTNESGLRAKGDLIHSFADTDERGL